MLRFATRMSEEEAEYREASIRVRRRTGEVKKRTRAGAEEENRRGCTSRESLSRLRKGETELAFK